MINDSRIKTCKKTFILYSYIHTYSSPSTLSVDNPRQCRNKTVKPTGLEIEFPLAQPGLEREYQLL